MKTITAKFRDRGGFSLAEVMLAVLLLVLLTAIITTGMPAAKTAYDKVVDASNAEVLLSTTVTELENEFTCSPEAVLASDNKTVVRFVGASGLWESLSNADGGITLTLYGGADGTGSTLTESRLLVSAKAATEPLHTTLGSVTYEDGVFIVHDLTVIKDGRAVASRDSYKIRAANDVKIVS